MKAIIDFITSHPLIPIRSLERAAGCPDQTIQQVITGQKPAIPGKWVWPIIHLLCEYGFTWNGWRFSYDKETDSFFVEKPIEAPPISHDKGDHFEYQIWMLRDVITDDIELIQFLKTSTDEKEIEF